MTITKYMLKEDHAQSQAIGVDVADMKVGRPLIALSHNVQLLRVSASAKWSANIISLVFYSINAQGKKVTDHATCKVRLTPNKTWLQDWKRNAYLFRSRIKALHNGVDHGASHKMKRGMVYKLFSTLVEYSPNYQGMQEVVLDSDDLEATAQVSFGVGDEGFHFNPCWIDSLGHIAGFIMNGNDNVQSKDQVFVNHGWDTMRCATKFSKGRKYQSYNKMQLVSGTMYSGDTYIFDEGNVVAIFEGVKVNYDLIDQNNAMANLEQFQGVPRQVLDQLLPSKFESAKSAPKPPKSKEGQIQVGMLSKSQLTADAASIPESASGTAKSPSSNGIVLRVMKIISEEAGLSLAELAPNSEFAEQGVDSLLSMTISGRIQEEMGLAISPTLFADYPTVKDLTDFLGENESEPVAPASSGDDEPLPTPGTDASSENDETSPSSGTRSDGILELIRATIAEETGVAIAELKPSTSFTELGMDSLLTLTIMGKLSEALGMELPATLLADSDTLNEIEKALGLTPKGRSGNEISFNAADPVDEAGRDLLPHATSILLQGNPQTAKGVLFLFPDGSGSATSYASLPKVSSDIAVYGLNCPWQKTPQDMKCSFESAATRYLLEIRRRQPRGPYYFGGWSAGGICAYETAQQLARKGETTARLILIDSPNPVGLENPPERMYDFFDSLDFFGTKGKAPPSWLRPHFNAFLATLDDYKVKPFAGPPLQTHIVYARDGVCKHPKDPRPEVRPDDPREMVWLLNNRTDFSGGGWGSLVGIENLKVHVLDDVNHFSMVAPGPKIQELSAFIKRAMQ